MNIRVYSVKVRIFSIFLSFVLSQRYEIALRSDKPKLPAKNRWSIIVNQLFLLSNSTSWKFRTGILRRKRKLEGHRLTRNHSISRSKSNSEDWKIIQLRFAKKDSYENCILNLFQMEDYLECTKDVEYCREFYGRFPQIPCNCKTKIFC